MSITLNDNFSSEFPKPLDNRFGSYIDVATALSQIPSFKRYIGLTVGIGTSTIVEYWFNGGILDANLVIKTADSTINWGEIEGTLSDQTDLQTALDDKASNTALNSHIDDLNNPHEVTKSQVGLGNVDNTSDLNKPISTATQTALNGKQDNLGFTAENVANKSISVTTDQASNTKYPSVKSVYDWANGLFATITQLGTKQDTLVSGTNIKTVNSNSLVGAGNVVIDKASVGLSNVANVDTTNASNISSGTLSDSRLSSNVTLQGNTFNTASKLVQLDATAKLPAVDGSQLTNLPTFSPPNGILRLASAISTTFQAVTDYLSNASVLFLNSRRIGIGKDTSVTTQSVAVVEVQDANTSIVLKPNGTGAILASVPDGTATGGNARGTNAVDLQQSRNTAGQVASGNWSTIVGGSGCIASGVGSISGGLGAFASNYGGVTFGNSNSNNSYGGVITGGQNNTGGNSDYIFIGGGRFNNTTGATNGVISGGISNTASSSYSTISGGQSNTASTNTHATVVGGSTNTSSGQYSVSGGRNTSATGSDAIAFGRSLVASGVNSFVSGQQSQATNNYSMAHLYYGLGYLYGQSAYGVGGDNTGQIALGRFQSSNVNAFTHAILTSGGTNGVYLDGTGTSGSNNGLIIPNGNNRAWNVQINTIAVVTAITGTATGVSIGDTYSEVKNLLFKRIGGTSSIVGTVDTSNIKSNTSMATALLTVTAGASQEMALTFTAPTFSGGGSVTCRIVSKVSLVECAY